MCNEIINPEVYYIMEVWESKLHCSREYCRGIFRSLDLAIEFHYTTSWFSADEKGSTFWVFREPYLKETIHEIKGWSDISACELHELHEQPSVATSAFVTELVGRKSRQSLNFAFGGLVV